MLVISVAYIDHSHMSCKTRPLGDLSISTQSISPKLIICQIRDKQCDYHVLFGISSANHLVTFIAKHIGDILGLEHFLLVWAFLADIMKMSQKLVVYSLQNFACFHSAIWGIHFTHVMHQIMFVLVYKTY